MVVVSHSVVAFVVIVAAAAFYLFVFAGMPRLQAHPWMLLFAWLVFLKDLPSVFFNLFLGDSVVLVLFRL